LAKKKVFLSYDYDHDLELKKTFLAQAKLSDSPFSVSNISLQESHPDSEWIPTAQRAIAGCDLFVVLLGPNTHSAPGVLKEIQIAKGIGKACFQLRPQGKKYSPLRDAGDVVVWKWKNLKDRLS
jgi:hypothetical protein